MKKIVFFCLMVACALLQPLMAQAQQGIISTVVGTGVAGDTGDGGLAINALLNGPSGVAVDGAGNLYIADTYNNQIRRVDPSGYIFLVAGTGTGGSLGDGGLAENAQLWSPIGIAIDRTGNQFIADVNNHKIRRVDALTGIITTVAGNGTAGFSGDSGLAINAQLNFPIDVIIDNLGNLYIIDTENGRVRKVNATTGIITTIAGNMMGYFGGDSGLAINAQLQKPRYGIFDAIGNLYIADTYNNRIRKIDAVTGIITTIAGGGSTGIGDGGLAVNAQLNFPCGLSIDGFGNLYISDNSNFLIRRVDAITGIITTVVGNGTFGYNGDGISAISAELNFPNSIAMDSSNNLYIADFHNNRIRKVIGPLRVGETSMGSSEVLLYPNPATEVLMLQTNERVYNTCTISNSIGQVLLQQSISSTQTTISVKGLATGLYFIKCSGEQGSIVRKFVKQ